MQTKFLYFITIVTQSHADLSEDDPNVGSHRPFYRVRRTTLKLREIQRWRTMTFSIVMSVRCETDHMGKNRCHGSHRSAYAAERRGTHDTNKMCYCIKKMETATSGDRPMIHCSFDYCTTHQRYEHLYITVERSLGTKYTTAIRHPIKEPLSPQHRDGYTYTFAILDVCPWSEDEQIEQFYCICEEPILWLYYILKDGRTYLLGIDMNKNVSVHQKEYTTLKEALHADKDCTFVEKIYNLQVTIRDTRMECHTKCEPSSPLHFKFPINNDSCLLQ